MTRYNIVHSPPLDFRGPLRFLGSCCGITGSRSIALRFAHEIQDLDQVSRRVVQDLDHRSCRLVHDRNQLCHGMILVRHGSQSVGTAQHNQEILHHCSACAIGPSVSQLDALGDLPIEHIPGDRASMDHTAQNTGWFILLRCDESLRSLDDVHIRFLCCP